MSLETLQELFADEIKDLYSAEKQLVKALPKMAKAASNADLKAGFEKHLEETKGQVERLEQVFELMGISPKAKHCNAMEGLVEEGSEIIEEEDADPEVKDAALITAAQKVEHYEIAAYGSARAHAELLGLKEAVSLLEETLNEEKATDEKLSTLAETVVNLEAKGADGEASEDDEADEASRSKQKKPGQNSRSPRNASR